MPYSQSRNVSNADQAPEKLAHLSRSKGRGNAIVGDAGISLHLTSNLFLGSKEMGEKILRILIKAGDIFVPEFFDNGKLTNKKKIRFDPLDLTLPLEGWVDERYSLGIVAERHRPVKSTLHVSSTDFLMFDYLELSVDSRWFTDKNHLHKLTNVAQELYSALGANSGYIQNWRYERVFGELTDEEGNLVGYRPPATRYALPGIFWANFFGPEYVEMFGKDKLMSEPWHSTAELPDGGLLLFVSESPFDASRPDYKAKKNELVKQLGKEVFEGTRLPQFRTDGRKRRDARPLVQSGGIRDDIFQ